MSWSYSVERSGGHFISGGGYTSEKAVIAAAERAANVKTSSVVDTRATKVWSTNVSDTWITIREEK
jgi:hypothetical protein